MAGPWTGPPVIGTPFEFNAVSSGTIGYPAGIVAGTPLFIAYHAGPVGQATPTFSDTDFQLVLSRTTNASSYLFWKIATGSETGTVTVTRPTASGQAYAQMCSFGGGPSTITSNVHAISSTGGGAATGLNYPSLTITQPGCLVIATGTKAANCSGVSVPSDFNGKIDEQHSAAGMFFVWEWAIVPGATNFPGGGWTIATDVSQSRNTIGAAFLPGAIITSTTPCTNGVFCNP